MENSNMLHCENCHALIPEESAKCPYCGALNVLGGEKKYMEQLFELKEDVEELQSVPMKEYRKEMGSIGRTLRRTIFFLVIIAAVAGIFFFCTEKFGGYEPSEEEIKAQMMWERENFPKLDALYEQGDYDGILDFETGNGEEEYYTLANWKHYDFINVYRWYRACKEDAAGMTPENYDEEDAAWCILDAMFVIQERTYTTYTDEEKALIDGYRREIKEILGTAFGMGEADIDSLYEECCITDEYGSYFDYDTAQKNIKKYVKNNIK